MGDLRIYTEDRKRVRRTASQELPVPPVYEQGAGSLPGFSRQAMAIAVRPFLVARGKRLVIALSDKEGDREVVLRLKRKVLLRARRG